MTQDVSRKLHVAIIMDGNGRWAKAQGKARTAGHRAGIEAVRRTLEAARDLSVGYLTLYSFSSENWSRPEGEVSELMGLLRFYLKNELSNFAKNNVRLRVIGDRERLAPDIVKSITEAEAKTATNTSLNLTLALSYGGRQELTAAARAMATEVAEGRLKPDAITGDLLASHLTTRDLPDPDLVIRTSGEMRISNFLLWQSAYAEYVFLDVLWPDFGKEHLKMALDEYERRDRRFGK